MKEQKLKTPFYGVIVAVGPKVGHARQAEAVARAMGLAYRKIDCAAPGAVDDAAAADFVIAAGRQSIRVARQARRRSQAPTCVLQPVLWRPGDFDVIWSPEHDRSSMPWPVPASVTRVFTLTAPSLPGCGAADALWEPPPHLPAPYVAVLVGGPTRIHRMRRDEVDELAGRLRAFAQSHRVSLLIATSRRTPAGVAARLADALHDVPHVLADARAPAAVGAGGAALPADPVAAFLPLAQAAVVTVDSVAMLSEAAAMGVPILGWRLPCGRSKFDRLHDGLLAHGAMRWFDGSLEPWSYRPIDAARTVADAMLSRLGLPVAR